MTRTKSGSLIAEEGHCDWCKQKRIIMRVMLGSGRMVWLCDLCRQMVSGGK